MDMEISQGRISDNLYNLGMVWYSLVVFEATQENEKEVPFQMGKGQCPTGI